ncbi:OmpA/MotB family protein [Clostridium intestinale]|jgi:chemotaxis protein MotB|uniref:OmpA/MotB family protein n=1 Tax=Clostridium intestinale TaxID=36845 RepID=UPI002DD64FFB|nr:OmpA family protein [Clostridium intestinale]WRY53741.1 OmpA family protein [Clostridium intestinale]
MRKAGRFSRFEGNNSDEEEANWQDSYSDLMTDLLAIFVILFSFAMMSQAIEINNMEKANNAIVEPLDATILPNQENFNSLYESIKAYVDESGFSEQLKVTKIDNYQILLRVEDSIFFESGKADINSDAAPLLNKISEMLIEYKQTIRMVRIEGHTDNRPIKTKEFDSNWELSTSRAVNVLRELVEISKLNSNMFSAVGYSEFHPVADNGSEEGMTQNRRVDFFIEAKSN